MRHFATWLEESLSSNEKPETLLTEMSGGTIELKPGAYSDGSPALTGSFDAPLPGFYYFRRGRKPD